MLEKHSQKTSVHFYKPDLFDYSHGEPPADVMTVLRALEVGATLRFVEIVDAPLGIGPSCFAHHDQQSQYRIAYPRPQTCRRSAYIVSYEKRNGLVQ